MSKALQSVCVFCGSRVGNNPEYVFQARKLGFLFAQKNIELVYGGGNIGLMGVIADAVLEKKGRVAGVIPGQLRDKEVAHNGLTELIVVETMHERKAIMAKRADAFIAMPGGFGTCDELFEILTWAQLGIHAKPVGILNTAGFFDPMLAWVNHMVKTDFLKQKHTELVIVDGNSETLLEKMLLGPKMVVRPTDKVQP